MNENNLTPQSFQLSEQENQRIFTEQIVPARFGDLKPALNPEVHFFGAQPGAGKSYIQATVKKRCFDQNSDEPVASIIGDEFRAYHPSYTILLRESDNLAAFYTDRDSGRWVEQAIEHSKKIGSHVILEGTLRSPDLTINTASGYRETGYSCEMHMIAVHEYVSRLRIFERYLSQVEKTGHGRYTVPASHDIPYQALPRSTSAIALSGQFDRINIYNATGNLVSSFDKTIESHISIIKVFNEQRSVDNLDLDSLIARASVLAGRISALSKHAVLKDLKTLIEEIEHAKTASHKSHEGDVDSKEAEVKQENISDHTINQDPSGQARLETPHTQRLSEVSRAHFAKGNLPTAKALDEREPNSNVGLRKDDSR